MQDIVTGHVLFLSTKSTKEKYFLSIYFKITVIKFNKIIIIVGSY